MININRKRKERNDKIASLQAEARSIAENNQYSREYKSDKTIELERQIEEVRKELEPEIYQAIQEYKEDKLQEVHFAEFDISPEEANIELLKEMRVQAKTKELIGKYQGKNIEQIRNQLTDELNELIQANSPYSKAYITAMNSLGVVGINTLVQEVEQSNMNSKQIKSLEDLEEIKQIERDFTRECGGRPIKEVFSDVFQAKMNKYK